MLARDGDGRLNSAKELGDAGNDEKRFEMHKYSNA